MKNQNLATLFVLIALTGVPASAADSREVVVAHPMVMPWQTDGLGGAIWRALKGSFIEPRQPRQEILTLEQLTETTGGTVELPPDQDPREPPKPPPTDPD